jgi:c-di-GMP-binding flagellar brake protein YcgR
MIDQDKRKTPRIDTHNLISYVCLNEKNDPIGQGMGRTLNISEGGILLETHTSIDPNYIVSFTLSLEDVIMDIKGKVTFNRKRDDGKFESGIQFIDNDESKTRILKQFAVIFKGEY